MNTSTMTPEDSERLNTQAAHKHTLYSIYVYRNTGYFQRGISKSVGDFKLEDSMQ